MSIHFVGGVETLHRSVEHLAVAHFDVTVAVCFANSSDTIAETVGSLVHQADAPPFELLLVSNGTSDDSVAIAEAASHGLPVRVIRCDSVGYDSNARNVSMVETAGDKLLFLDADDTVGPDYVATMALALDDAPLVTSMWDTSVLNPDRPRAVANEGTTTLLPLDKAGWTYAGAGTLGVRREVTSAIGGFDPALRYAANNEWCFRAFAAGFEMVAVPDAFVHVRHRADLWGGVRQRYRWGLWEVAAERVASAYGLPRTSLESTARRYLALARSSLRIRTSQNVFFFLLGLSHATGRTTGSVRFRTAADVHAHEQRIPGRRHLESVPARCSAEQRAS